MSCPVLRQDEQRILAVHQSELHISDSAAAHSRVLTVDGLLDETTYRPLRDAIVKAALDEPDAVIADVNALAVPNDPAWAVFTSASWQVAEWPDIPIGVVCAHAKGRNALRCNGITRYVPVYPTLESAVAELPADALRRYRRRVRASLPPVTGSIHRCRDLAVQWLTEWSRTDFIHAVSIVTTELVETALTNTDYDFALRMETDGSTVAVAVQHVDIQRAGRHRADDSDTVSSLRLVAANSRVWGRYTTARGNTIWAVVGPENRF